jgi:hypothetical protein
MYPVGQQYKINGLGFMIVSRALCIFTLCPTAFERESAGDGEICSGRLATDATYVKNLEEVASVTINLRASAFFNQNVPKYLVKIRNCSEAKGSIRLTRVCKGVFLGLVIKHE